MKILLLNPPFVKNFMRNARWAVVGISGSEWPPIFLSYATGLLEREGHKVKLLDAQNHNMTHEETYKAANKFKPELLVLYFSSASLNNDVLVGQKIKELTGCKVILVGPYASIDPKKTLKEAENIDMLAKGEFDFTVLDVANKVPKKKIKGLYYRKAGKVLSNPDRPPVSSEELDKLPFVTDIYRRHLDIRDYHQTGHQHPFVDMFTGRGCSWGLCTFCLWPNTINKGAKYRTRSITNVIAELKFIKKKMPEVKEVFFQDDTMPKERAIAISQAIIDNKIKICWSCYSRANLDFDTLKLMKKAGCRTMHVGYESADQKILNCIKKGITPKMAEEFTKNANKAGLFIVADLITGLPYETPQTIKKTINWAKKLPVQRYTVTLPKPYPETPLYDFLKEHNYINDKGEVNYPNLSWEKINELNRWSMRTLYFSPEYLFRMATKPYEWGRLLRSAVFFIPYLISKKKQLEYSGHLENDKIREKWEKYWEKYDGVTKLGALSQKMSLKKTFEAMKKMNIGKKMKIIDVGCGEGRTLKSFLKNGYTNIIGIDFSNSSIKICKKNGLKQNRKVFLMDVKNNGFKDNSFDVVFSEGLLEHYSDPCDLIKEMTRISKKYIILIQPNHSSIYGQMIRIYGQLIRKDVKEYSFSVNYFKKEFGAHGFSLSHKDSTQLNEFNILIFEKR